jgi:hypothetical protein
LLLLLPSPTDIFSHLLPPSVNKTLAAGLLPHLFATVTATSGIITAALADYTVMTPIACEAVEREIRQLDGVMYLWRVRLMTPPEDVNSQ